jgi:hypothetical protein
VVIIKGYVFWNVMPCSTLKDKLSYGRICFVHFQVRRIIEATKHGKSGSKQGFAYLLDFQQAMWR